MELKDLGIELSKLGLHLCKQNDANEYSVVKNGIANPLFFFRDNKEDYTGSIIFKSYNVCLYSQEQVYKALCLVDEYLR